MIIIYKGCFVDEYYGYKIGDWVEHYDDKFICRDADRITHILLDKSKNEVFIFFGFFIFPGCYVSHLNIPLPFRCLIRKLAVIESNPDPLVEYYFKIRKDIEKQRTL